LVIKKKRTYRGKHTAHPKYLTERDENSDTSVGRLDAFRELGFIRETVFLRYAAERNYYKNLDLLYSYSVVGEVPYSYHGIALSMQFN